MTEQVQTGSGPQGAQSHAAFVGTLCAQSPTLGPRPARASSKPARAGAAPPAAMALPGGDGRLGRAEVPQWRGRWDRMAVRTELCRARRGQLNVCGLVSGAPGRRFISAPNNKHRAAQTQTPGIVRGADLPRYEPGPSRADGDSKSRAPCIPRGGLGFELPRRLFGLICRLVQGAQSVCSGETPPRWARGRSIGRDHLGGALHTEAPELNLYHLLSTFFL